MRIEIFIYTLTWMLCYVIIQSNYSRFRRQYANYELDDFADITKKKINYISICDITLLWVAFNAFITMMHPITGGDRMNYLVNFTGQRETPSLGLSWMITIVRALGGNMNTLFYITTFICLFITMLAYRYSEDATPKGMVLLFLTQYEYITLTALKQAYTSAIASLVLVLLIQKHTKKTEILCVVLVALACVFHPTGYILVPLCLILLMNVRKREIALYAVLIIAFALFFQPIMLMLGRILSPIIPSLGTKIAQYFSEAAGEAGESLSISFLKGLPIYLIAILGLIKRRTLVNKVEYYDKYLIVCLTGAFLFFMSIYSVWLYRFIYLFYLPIFIFYGKIINNLSIKSNKKIIDPVIYLGLAVILYRFLYIVYK